MTDEERRAALKQVHDRSEARKEFFQEVGALGKRVGLGATALEELVTRVMDAACDSLIKPEDAKLIYQRYAKAANPAGTGASLRTNTSKIKKLIQLGNHNDGRQLIAEAKRLRGTVEKSKSLVEGLVEVSRRHQEAKRLLNEDEIKAALVRPEPKAKAKSDDIEALIAAKDWDRLRAIISKIEAAMESGAEIPVALQAAGTVQGNTAVH